MIDAVSDMQLAQREPEAVDETVTHINLGGIRYLAVAPVYALRRAVREYRDINLVPRSDTLSYLAECSSVVFCRGDYERALTASNLAASDIRLSPESRRTFARVRDVLDHAIPRDAFGTALAG